jgi:hypothetical protein
MLTEWSSHASHLKPRPTSASAGRCEMFGDADKALVLRPPGQPVEPLDACCELVEVFVPLPGARLRPPGAASCSHILPSCEKILWVVARRRPPVTRGHRSPPFADRAWAREWIARSRESVAAPATACGLRPAHAPPPDAAAAVASGRQTASPTPQAPQAASSGPSPRVPGRAPSTPPGGSCQIPSPSPDPWISSATSRCAGLATPRHAATSARRTLVAPGAGARYPANRLAPLSAAERSQRSPSAAGSPARKKCPRIKVLRQQPDQLALRRIFLMARLTPPPYRQRFGCTARHIRTARCGHRAAAASIMPFNSPSVRGSVK